MLHLYFVNYNFFALLSFKLKIIIFCYNHSWSTNRCLFVMLFLLLLVYLIYVLCVDAVYYVLCVGDNFHVVISQYQHFILCLHII